jgi:N-acetylglucosaminyl-diphospho-decaprenol L-rhamnosyltransferase
MHETDEVTVVVATRNRHDQLRDTVRRHRAPVIVVDNASADPVRLAGTAVVRLEDNRGAAARNVGVELAETPYVAFADDDSYWAPGSLARAAEVLRDHPLAGLLTAQVRVGADNRLDPVSAGMATAPLGRPPDSPGPAVLGFLACSVIVRRDAFLAAGGFERRLFLYGEEPLLAMDLAAAGWQLAYVPSLTVHHLPKPAGRDERARARLEARNRVLTAMLRRPPAVVARTLTAAVQDRAGVLRDLLPHVVWAVRHRRRLPADVEAAVESLRA